MARKLKTYITSLGFFEEAIAAPSMKAAIDAWGGDQNLFHKGFASETNDQAIIAATLKYPGTVLKRPVGSTGPFKKQAELPASLPVDYNSKKETKSSKAKKPSIKAKIANEADTHKAAAAYEREEKRRKQIRQKEKAAEEKAAKQRAVLVAKANASLEKAQKEHDTRLARLEAELAAINKKIETEKSDWSTKRSKLEATIEKVR